MISRLLDRPALASVLLAIPLTALFMGAIHLIVYRSTIPAGFMVAAWLSVWVCMVSIGRYGCEQWQSARAKRLLHQARTMPPAQARVEAPAQLPPDFTGADDWRRDTLSPVDLRPVGPTAVPVVERIANPTHSSFDDEE